MSLRMEIRSLLQYRCSKILYLVSCIYFLRFLQVMAMRGSWLEIGIEVVAAPGFGSERWLMWEVVESRGFALEVHTPGLWICCIWYSPSLAEILVFGFHFLDL
jgi:hypothetical protein